MEEEEEEEEEEKGRHSPEWLVLWVPTGSKHVLVCCEYSYRNYQDLPKLKKKRNQVNLPFCFITFFFFLKFLFNLIHLSTFDHSCFFYFFIHGEIF